MFEVMLCAELLSKGLPVDVATPQGEDLVSTTGITYRADRAFAALKVSDYACILVPGGDPYEILENTHVDRVLQNADRQGIIIGAICAGPVVLAKAGTLKGRKFTHGYGDHNRELLAPFWAGALFIDAPVVVADHILTAKPEAHVEFAVTAAQLTGVVKSAEEADYFRNFYVGRRIAKPASV
jgi:putative intracellular protease/amidase